jgi:hypothetical protein
MIQKYRLPLIIFIITSYVVVFWHRLLIFGLVPFHGDTLCFYYPNWAIGKALLKDGFCFLWEPYRNMGQPFLASPQNQALYPLRLIGVFLNYVDYIRLSVVFHTLLSAGFGYLFVKHWTKKTIPGIVAALGWGFSGPLFSRVVLHADFCTMAWVPVLLFFLISNRPILFSIALALQWMAGYPPLFIVSYIGLICVGWVIKPRKPWFICLGKGSLLGLGLASIQIVPFLEMLKESVRPVFLKTEAVILNPVHPDHILRGFFLPSFLHSYFPSFFQHRGTFYFGPIIAFLFGWGWYKGKTKERVLVLMALASLFLSLGNKIGFYQYIPFIRVFRYPGNWLLLTTIFVFMGAASGITKLRNRKISLALVILLAIDLLIYVLPLRFPFGDLTFIANNSVALPGLPNEAGPHRILHTENIITEYSTLDENSQELWPMIKKTLYPSHGTALGYRETSSHYHLTSKRNFEYRRRLNFGPFDPKLLEFAEVSHIIGLKNKDYSGTVPLLTDFFVRKNPNPVNRVFGIDGLKKVKLISERPGKFNVEAEGPGLVVVSESYYPGWKVTIDGELNDVNSFEKNFLSIEVGPGQHTIGFNYSPLSFWIGFIISGTTFLVVIFLFRKSVGVI